MLSFALFEIFSRCGAEVTLIEEIPCLLSVACAVLGRISGGLRFVRFASEIDVRLLINEESASLFDEAGTIVLE